MAGFAAGGRRYVAWRLANGLRPVVAGRATAQCLGMIKFHRRRKRAGRVTSAAPICAENVTGGFRRCVNPCSHRVTRRAVARCAFKHSANMTRLTGNLLVFTFQLESRGQVIERFLRGGLCSEDQAKQGEWQQQEPGTNFHTLYLIESERL